MVVAHKTMDRKDLFLGNSPKINHELNSLIEELYSKDLYPSSWYGGLPVRIGGLERGESIGANNRDKDYKPLSNSVDDNRFPWFLYWEIAQVIGNCPLKLEDQKVLDVGGTSSLFSCYLASKGSKVYSIDLSNSLKENAEKITRKMGWDMNSYVMDAKSLEFPENFFDMAFSVCAFEHFPFKTKQRALTEISRCLKPQKPLSLTFDYKNPAPFIEGVGPDRSEENRIGSPEDIKRSFLSTDNIIFRENEIFLDNGLTYLTHPTLKSKYTFGAIFLKNDK